MINFIFIATFALCYGVCFYVWIAAMVKDIETDFIAFNDCVKMEPNSAILCKKLIDLIVFHSTVIRYNKRSNMKITLSNDFIKGNVTF